MTSASFSMQGSPRAGETSLARSRQAESPVVLVGTSLCDEQDSALGRAGGRHVQTSDGECIDEDVALVVARAVVEYAAAAEQEQSA